MSRNIKIKGSLFARFLKTKKPHIMKKSLFMIGAIVFGAIVFTSCEKEEKATPLTIDLSKTASMKGYLFAELDKTAAGTEAAPAGTKVYGYITNADILNSSANGLWADTVAVQADGSYTFNFPIGLTNSTLNIVPLAFEANQKQGFGSYAAEVPGIYTYSTTTVVSTNAGGDIPQLTYNFNVKENYQQMTKISGKLLADMTALNGGYEMIPSGQTVTFHCDGWMATVTSEGSGNYSLEVPVGKNIYATSEFVANYIINLSTTEASTYSVSAQKVGPFGTSISKNNDIYFDRTKN
jgi:hypothetical protein